MKYHLRWLRWKNQPDNQGSLPVVVDRAKAAKALRRDQGPLHPTLVLRPGKAWVTICNGGEHIFLTWLGP